jgi:AraC-like DNA-binding protein
MATRRRIDWSIILGPGKSKAAWGEHAAPVDLIAELFAFEDLFQIDDTDTMLKRAVELSLSRIGLVRAGLYLYDAPVNLMLGTWGTNLQRKVIDEHHAMFELDGPGKRVFDRAMSGTAHWTVVEDCPIIDQSHNGTQVVGQGWVVCTPIRSATTPLGMLYNDAGLTNSKVDPDKQARTALLCWLVGALLSTVRHARSLSHVPNISSKHPMVVRIVRMLAQDPTLGGNDMAKTLGVSLSRVARLFKSEMGLSLVEYRNRLRLDRFFVLADTGGSNLLEAALTAGFGSYAQFHRVFCGIYKLAPREYLLKRGRTVKSRR